MNKWSLGNLEKKKTYFFFKEDINTALNLNRRKSQRNFKASGTSGTKNDSKKLTKEINTPGKKLRRAEKNENQNSEKESQNLGEKYSDEQIS